MKKFIVVLFFISYSSFGAGNPECLDSDTVWPPDNTKCSQSNIECNTSNYKDFIYTYQSHCDLRGADLSKADLSSANLIDVSYNEKTNFTGAFYNSLTRFPYDFGLPEAKGMLRKDVSKNVVVFISFPQPLGHEWSRHVVHINYTDKQTGLPVEFSKSISYTNGVQRYTLSDVLVDEEITVKGIYKQKDEEYTFIYSVMGECTYSNILMDRMEKCDMSKGFVKLYIDDRCDESNYTQFVYQFSTNQIRLSKREKCYLDGAELTNRDLSDANFSQTFLNADLRGANLTNTILYDTNMDDAITDEHTVFAKTLINSQTDLPGFDMLFRKTHTGISSPLSQFK